MVSETRKITVGGVIYLEEHFKRHLSVENGSEVSITDIEDEHGKALVIRKA